MNINEMKSVIMYLREKKDIALRDIERYSDGSNGVKSSHYLEYKSIFSSLIVEVAKQKPSYAIQYAEVTKSEMYYDLNLKAYDGVVNAIDKEIDMGLIVDMQKSTEDSCDEVLTKIFDNFHNCARQARNRYNARSTIDISDEYDVQDFIHILLRLYYNDIRAEEYTPSYAGSSGRMDFLLYNEKVVIEVKRTRQGLKDREIGNQLIEDIARYQAHDRCKSLYCFVYDPEGLVGNPKGIENDLSGINGSINVKVIIRP